MFWVQSKSTRLACFVAACIFFRLSLSKFLLSNLKTKNSTVTQHCISDSLWFSVLHLTCELWGRDPPAPGPAAADWLQRSSLRSSEDSLLGSSVGFCSSQRSRLTLLLCWHEFYSADTVKCSCVSNYTRVLLYMLLSPSGESLSSLLLESILLSAHGSGPLLSYWLQTNISEYYVKKWMCI